MSKATTAERALNRKGGTMSRLIKTLFGFYPVLLPLVVVGVVLCAIINSIGATFLALGSVSGRAGARARKAAREDVQPYAGPADSLLRHASARRHHEPLHQRHRHAAPDDQPVAAQPAHDDHRHRHGVLYHAVLQRVDVPGHCGRRRLYDLYDQAARLQLRALLHCAADRARRGRGPYRGSHERPEGRQGILPRVCRRGRF